jgi:uncharacterized membrane protein (DUF485 family)
VTVLLAWLRCFFAGFVTVFFMVFFMVFVEMAQRWRLGWLAVLAMGYGCVTWAITFYITINIKYNVRNNNGG